MVVDGLLHSLPLLEGLDLFKHEVKIVLKRVEGSESSLLPVIMIIKMVVIKVDNSGEIRYQGVSLSSSWGETSASKRPNVSSQDRSEMTYESRLSTSRISSDTNNHRGLSILQSHVQAKGGGGSG